MTGEFMREERYIVFKMSDLGNSLKGDEIRRLARQYAEHRQHLRKKPLECVVVEKDWPEYESTWRAIEARTTGAQPAANFADAYQGAMEEVAIWKKRALEAEDLNRKFVAEINGPTYMGEPAHPKPDCGEAGHDEGRCGNRQCLPGAQPAPSVPDGWKLVPIEPTTEIRKAMHYAYWQSPQLPYHDGSPELWNAAYAAMLEAAPEAK